MTFFFGDFCPEQRICHQFKQLPGHYDKKNKLISKFRKYFKKTFNKNMNQLDDCFYVCFENHENMILQNSKEDTDLFLELCSSPKSKKEIEKEIAKADLDVSQMDKECLKRIKEDIFVNEIRYDHNSGSKFIKKVLIYLVLAMDNFLNFLEIQLLLQHNLLLQRSEYEINEKVSKNNKRIMKNKINLKRNGNKITDNMSMFFEMDTDLANCSIEDLIKKIKITDLAAYLQVSQIYFFKNHPNYKPNQNSKIQNTREILVNPQLLTERFHNKSQLPNNLKITVSKFEIDEVLLALRKRPDESLKHAFKSIRSRMFTKDSLLGKRSRPNLMSFEDPNSIWLEQKDISTSNPPDINKKNINKAKQHEQFLNLAKKYVSENFLIDDILKKIENKYEVFFDPQNNENNENNTNFSFFFYLRKLMTKEKKFCQNIQNILNSLCHVLNIDEKLIITNPTSANSKKKNTNTSKGFKRVKISRTQS